MLLKPNIKQNRITGISPALLKKHGVNALILDVDNTLSTHHGQQVTEGLEAWLAQMRGKKIKLIILSNSKKERVEPFAAKIGLEYISMGLKPLPFRFFTAMRAMGSKRKETAIVGDQIFTDVLGGNIAGMTTILLDPILPETTWFFRLKRKLEKWIFKIYGIRNGEE